MQTGARCKITCIHAKNSCDLTYFEIIKPYADLVVCLNAICDVITSLYVCFNQSARVPGSHMQTMVQTSCTCVELRWLDGQVVITSYHISRLVVLAYLPMIKGKDTYSPQKMNNLRLRLLCSYILSNFAYRA